MIDKIHIQKLFKMDIIKIWMVPLTTSTTLDISSVVVRQSACAVNRYIFAYNRMNKLNCIISWWELAMHPFPKVPSIFPGSNKEEANANEGLELRET